MHAKFTKIGLYEILFISKSEALSNFMCYLEKTYHCKCMLFGILTKFILIDFNNNFLLNSRKVFLEHCSVPFISNTTKTGMNKMLSLPKPNWNNLTYSKTMVIWKFLILKLSLYSPRPQLVCFRLTVSESLS